MNFNPIMLKAGAEIMRVYARDITVMIKTDASPVTEADERAERIILDNLKILAPGIPVVAEEEAAAGRLPEIGNKFFLVDPLDGTKEFISKNGEFTVNIALIEDGFPVYGAVYAPALGRLFWGGGVEAFAADVVDGTVANITPIRVRPAPKAGLTAIGSRSHGGDATQDYLKDFAVADFIVAGSSLKFCRLAEGSADIYPRLGRTMEWDTAAGDAVLRAAGGRVETMDGSPLLYGKHIQEDAPFANPHFVAFGHADIRRATPL